MASALPEFPRDPKTGRYLKNDRHTPQCIKNLERDYQYKTLSKTPNILDVLRSREQGTTSGLQTVRSYYQVKMLGKSTEVSNDIDSMPLFTIQNCEFIKGGPHAIYGLWTIADVKYRYAVGELPQINIDEDDTIIGFRASNKCVDDICRVFPNTLMYIYSHDTDGQGMMDMMWKDGTQSKIYEHFHSGRGPLYCCSDQFNEVHHLAVGGQDKISYYQGISHINDFHVSGKVQTISFDEEANCIFSGHSNGFMYVEDVRDINSQTFTLVEKGLNKGLVDSYFLPPNQVIFTGVSNKIYTIDLRILRPMNSFLGHKQSVKKTPFSIANSMLCTNGADNVIRIWHLSGGLPIHEIRPTIKGNKIKGWLTSDADKTYLYHFEGSKKTIYQV